MSQSTNNAVGKYGEQIAANYLADTGLVILDRNWRCSDGELDIIAREGKTAVFCEVKTRRSNRFGEPASAVGQVKAQRIRRLALHWLAQTGLRPTDLRFDVVSVWPAARGSARVEHLRGAF